MSSYLDKRFEGLPDTLTVQQLADAIGRGLRTTYELLRTDKLPGWKVGETWVIYRDEVKAAMEEERQQRRARAAAGLPLDADDLGVDEA